MKGWCFVARGIGGQDGREPRDRKTQIRRRPDGSDRDDESEKTDKRRDTIASHLAREIFLQPVTEARKEP